MNRKHFSLRVALKLETIILPVSYIVGHVGIYGLAQFTHDPIPFFSKYGLGAGALTLVAGQIVYGLGLFQRFNQLDQPSNRKVANRYRREIGAGHIFNQSIPAPAVIDRNPGESGFGGALRAVFGSKRPANSQNFTVSAVLPPPSLVDPYGNKIPLDVFERWFFTAAKYNQRGKGFGEAFWTRPGYPGRRYEWWSPLFYEPCMIIVIDAQLKLHTPILYHNAGNGWTTLVIPATRALAYIYRVQFPDRVTVGKHMAGVGERGRPGTKYIRV